MNRDLSWSLRRLGNVSGQPLDVVVAHLGQARSLRDGAGCTLHQWTRSDYHITLKFDKDDLCLGITHQTSRPIDH
jgi:hypothetical protein